VSLGVRMTVTAFRDVTMCTVGGRYEPFADTFRMHIILGTSVHWVHCISLILPTT